MTKPEWYTGPKVIRFCVFNEIRNFRVVQTEERRISFKYAESDDFRYPSDSGFIILPPKTEPNWVPIP